MAESKKKVDNVFETLSAINVNEYVEKKVTLIMLVGLI